MRPRLLLVEPDAAFRLRAIGVLRESFEVTVPAPGEDVVRLCRATRPEVGCLNCGGRNRVEALRLARVLKTDVRIVPALGFYARTGEGVPSRAALESVLGDGLLAAADDPEALLAFAQALLAGAHPMPDPWPVAPPSLLRRAVSRILSR